jgi:hypothetical protein
MSHTTARLPEVSNIVLETPITPGELHHAMKQGKKNKATEFDGISHEFVHTFWEVTPN